MSLYVKWNQARLPRLPWDQLDNSWEVCRRPGTCKDLTNLSLVTVITVEEHEDDLVSGLLQLSPQRSILLTQTSSLSSLVQHTGITWGVSKLPRPRPRPLHSELGPWQEDFPRFSSEFRCVVSARASTAPTAPVPSLLHGRQAQCWAYALSSWGD